MRGILVVIHRCSRLLQFVPTVWECSSLRFASGWHHRGIRGEQYGKFEWNQARDLTGNWQHFPQQNTLRYFGSTRVRRPSPPKDNAWFYFLRTWNQMQWSFVITPEVLSTSRGINHVQISAFMKKLQTQFTLGTDVLMCAMQNRGMEDGSWSCDAVSKRSKKVLSISVPCLSNSISVWKASRLPAIEGANANAEGEMT